MTGRMALTVQYFTEGETEGNLSASMVKANYSESYAKTGCDKLSKNVYFIEAVARRKKAIDIAKNLTIEAMKVNFAEDRALCLEANDRTNLIRIDESFAKHVGFYAKDKDVPAETQALDKEQQIQAQVLGELMLTHGPEIRAEIERRGNIKLKGA